MLFLKDSSSQQLTKLFWRTVLESALCFVLSKDEFASASLASLSRVPTQASWRVGGNGGTGSLGFVHWASQYGYEHRRHEGEQLMNISNCTTFVFTKRSLKADLPSIESQESLHHRLSVQYLRTRV